MVRPLSLCLLTYCNSSRGIVLAGSLQVLVNGGLVGTLREGACIGELAHVSNSTTRAATLVSMGKTVVAVAGLKELDHYHLISESMQMRVRSMLTLHCVELIRKVVREGKQDLATLLGLDKKEAPKEVTRVWASNKVIQE